MFYIFFGIKIKITHEVLNWILSYVLVVIIFENIF